MKDVHNIIRFYCIFDKKNVNKVALRLVLPLYPFPLRDDLETLTVGYPSETDDINWWHDLFPPYELQQVSMTAVNLNHGIINQRQIYCSKF